MFSNKTEESYSFNRALKQLDPFLGPDYFLEGYVSKASLTKFGEGLLTGRINYAWGLRITASENILLHKEVLGMENITRNVGTYEEL